MLREIKQAEPLTSPEGRKDETVVLVFSSPQLSPILTLLPLCRPDPMNNPPPSKPH